MQRIDKFDGEHKFLSNFYMRSFLFNGVVCKSGEHAYQAAKAHEPEHAAYVLEAATAAGAKARGRRIKMRPRFDSIKDIIMLQVARAKFNEFEMANMLLSTGDAELIEGNTWGDTYWGVCRGTGLNKLGQILMLVRSEIYESRRHDSI